jgi:peroxiredoxin
MVKNLALVIVAAAVLQLASCAKTEPTAGTATVSNETGTSETSTAAARTAKMDSEVVQTGATVESPAQPREASGEIGATAPAWENLTGTDDKQHSLQDLEDAKAVAVIFTCNSCPVAVAYEDRIVQLANDYKDKGVEVVAINVNKDESNALPAMKERAEEKGFTFAYLFDPTQQIARDYGATVTPHAFVLNEARKVVYAGAIDDNQNDPAAVKEQHLRKAIDATLAGQEPEVASVRPVGCGIKYE